LDLTITEVVAIFGAIFLVVAPFVINAGLAKQNSKSVNTILILTFIFGWIVTLILLGALKNENFRSRSRREENFTAGI
ncbi:MAG TPA: hypothetical protein DDX98_12095, partial [Bacteroidales bacterium]|nr:hypothetical protein [Bacteroidales bacterium]